MATFSAIGANTGTSSGTSATTGASNTKGSWVELLSSSSHATTQVYLNVNPGSTQRCYLVDIGTGAAASESVLFPDIYIDQRAEINANFNIRADVSTSTRFAVRTESDSGGSGSITVAGTIASASPPAISSASYTAYGLTSGVDDKGTSLDPGGSANTKGSYVEITSSASATAQHMYLYVGKDRNATMVAANWLIDIAIGSAASESVLIPNLWVTGTSQEFLLPAVFGPFFAQDIQSQRVAVRAQCDIIDTVDRLLRVGMLVVSGTEVTAGGSGEGPLIGGRLVL